MIFQIPSVSPFDGSPAHPQGAPRADVTDSGLNPLMETTYLSGMAQFGDHFSVRTRFGSLWRDKEYFESAKRCGAGPFRRG